MIVGFQTLEFTTMENSSAVATVCAQIDGGSLEREVMAYLTSVALIGDTALGMLYIIGMHMYYDSLTPTILTCMRICRTIASSPGPFPAFQCCTLKSGRGPGTRSHVRGLARRKTVERT